MPFLVLVNPAVSGTVQIDVDSQATLARAIEAAELRWITGPSFVRAMYTTGSSFTVEADNSLDVTSDANTLVYSEADDLADWTDRLGPPG